MLAIDAGDGEAAAGLARALRHVGSRERARVIDRIRPILAEVLGLDDGKKVVEGPVASTIVFDVSDLVPFLRHAKRPTGIQRVQLEVVAAALTHSPPEVEIALCCMDEASDRWRGMTPATFLRLFAALTEGFYPSPRDRVFVEVQLSLLVAPDFIFGDHAVIVSLGASWWLGNYFLALRAVQAGKGTIYLPFIHDLIPLLHPQWHVASLIGEFSNWFSSAVAHADAFLVNSKATRDDLVRAAALAGSTIDPDDVAVIPLDAGAKADVRPTVVPDPSLPNDPFVLMIGTVEPRKGHDIALAAWQHLLARGAAPRLVCVGGKGWLNGPFYETLAADPRLAAHVDLLSGIDDDMLIRLYDRSLFTIYPSRYEGWGLPVTEALCRGKVVVTTSASSLPEAGGDFALYVPPGDPAALASTVAALVDDPEWRRVLEDRIATQFRPRSWRQIAEQIVAEATHVAVARSRCPRPSIRPALSSCFYSLKRTTHLPLPAGSAAGEVYRLGAGWHWPDGESNRVRGENGGELAFTILSDVQRICRIRVNVLLNGVAGRSCRWRVAGKSGEISEGLLPPSGRQWVSINTSADLNGVVALTIQGQAQPATASIVLPDEPDRQEGDGEGVGVEGFFFMPVTADGSVETGEAEVIRRKWLNLGCKSVMSPTGDHT